MPTTVARLQFSTCTRFTVSECKYSLSCKRVSSAMSYIQCTRATHIVVDKDVNIRLEEWAHSGSSISRMGLRRSISSDFED